MGMTMQYKNYWLTLINKQEKNGPYVVGKMWIIYTLNDAFTLSGWRES